MNVKEKGSFGYANKYIKDNEYKLNLELRMPTTGKPVIPYYAGGRLLDSKSIKVITAAEYVNKGADPGVLRKSYEILSNWNFQINFVVDVVAEMIGVLSIDKKNLNKYTIQEWTNWFQVYFEQPAKIESRVWDASVLSLRSE